MGGRSGASLAGGLRLGASKALGHDPSGREGCRARAGLASRARRGEIAVAALPVQPANHGGTSAPLRVRARNTGDDSAAGVVQGLEKSVDLDHEGPRLRRAKKAWRARVHVRERHPRPGGNLGIWPGDSAPQAGEVLDGRAGVRLWQGAWVELATS